MNNKSNKNPILKKFPKSASTKDVTLENQSKNEKNEIIQLRSNLSTKELDDININTPNSINNNNRISLKKYVKRKRVQVRKIYVVDSLQNLKNLYLILEI